MIRIDMIQQDTRHPDKRRRHQGRASCEVAGCRFETEGPAPIYRMATLLWLHGHRGADFEVWDNLSPFGKPGGLAMTGRVRNWARLVKGKVTFDRQAKPATEFTPKEVELIARAAGRIFDAAGIDSPAAGNARPAPISVRDSPEVPPEGRWGLCPRFYRSHSASGMSRITLGRLMGPKLGRPPVSSITSARIAAAT